MSLAQVPLDGQTHAISDWFELYVLCSRFRNANFSYLSRAWDKRRNSEDSNPEGKGVDTGHDGDELFLEQVLSEIRKRVDFLGDSYPFEFTDANEGLTLAKDLTVGQTVYLLCLLLSNNDNSQIFDLSKFTYKLTNEVRNHFQACSTWAAGGAINGSSFAFGFPRPDSTNFLEKVSEVYTFKKDGKARKTPLKGVSTSPKDEGIDIIAFGQRADDAAGKFYMLGQVASGNNWPDKSILGMIDPYHKQWFDVVPSSPVVAAMFIPHCITLLSGASLNEQLSVLTIKFGQVYYRYVLPKLAHTGFELQKSNPSIKIELIEDYPSIKSWVEKTIQAMRKVSQNKKLKPKNRSRKAPKKIKRKSSKKIKSKKKK
jgi:hypothetical protein